MNGNYLNLKSPIHFRGSNTLRIGLGDTCATSTLRAHWAGSNESRKESLAEFLHLSTLLSAPSCGQREEATMKAQARERAAQRAKGTQPVDFRRVVLALPAPQALDVLTSVSVLQADHGEGTSGNAARGGRARRQSGRTAASLGIQPSTRGTATGTAAQFPNRGGRHGRGRGAGAARGNKGRTIPRGWTAPAIAPSARTPPRLRPRPISNLTTPDSQRSRGQPARRARIGGSPRIQGGVNRTVAANIGQQSTIQHPPIPQLSPLASRSRQNGVFTVPQPRDRRLRNLQGEFDRAARVHTWVDDLNAVDNPPTEEQDVPHDAAGNDSHEQEHLLRDVATLIPVNNLPCQPNGPNNRQGTMLPDGVWVRLPSLEYEPRQWAGLQAFCGDPILATWEGTVQFFGVQFGGGVGYHLVPVTECLMLDWRLWPADAIEKSLSPAHGVCPSVTHDGTSTMRQEQSPLAMTGGDSVSQGAIFQSEVDLEVTPPRAGRSAKTAIDCSEYELLHQYDGWTSDSQDASWMADYRDFIGKSSDDENSDWELLSTSDGPIGEELDLDLNAYRNSPTLIEITVRQ